MNGRNVTWFSLAAAVVVCALLGVPAHSEGWEMLPGDVVMAIHFDMKSLAASELYGSLAKKYGERIPNPGAEYLDFIEATGFDVERDLDSVTIGAGMPVEGTEGPFYMVVRGRFDREKIDAYASESGKVRSGTHDDLTTYVPLDVKYDGPAPVIAWTDDETMILASFPDFSKLVGAVRGDGLSAKDSALGRLLTAAQGQFYVAMQIPELAPGGEGSKQLPVKGLGSLFSQLQNPAVGPMQHVETILVTLEAQTGLDLAVRASADSAENGRLVYEMLNGYLMLGRSMAAQNPQAAGILDHLELDHTGSTVEISVSMSGDDVHAALREPHTISDD